MTFQSLVDTVRDIFRTASPQRSMATVVCSIVVALIVGAIVSPSSQRLAPPRPVSAPVVTTTFVCPDFRGAARVSRTTIVATVPAGLVDVTTKAGKAPLSLLTKKGKAPVLGAVLAPGGASIVTSARSAVGPVVGKGSGRLAPGFSAGQLTVQFSGIDRGLSGVDCADVASEQWFVGGGAASGQRTSLILVNPEATAATADVEFFGNSGRLEAPGGAGIVIRSRSTRIIALDGLVPGEGILAIHVKASVGRLAMAVRTTDRSGAVPLGSDYIPPGAAPANRLVIPALPKGSGDRSLLVVAPGFDDADVRLKVIGRSGTFAPSGADRFTVSAGSVKKIDLSRILESENSALLIESDVPITAGARVRFRAKGRGQKAEYAWSSAVAPIDTTAVEPSSRVGDGFAAYLLLSCPQGTCRVQVLTGPPGRKPKTTTLTLAPGITYTVALGGRGDRGQVVTVVTPLEGSAPIYAGRVQTRKSPDGVLLTISPLRDARISVQVPHALPDLSAAIPSAF